MKKAELQKVASSREMIFSLLLMVAILFLFIRMFYSPKSEEIGIIKDKVSNLQLEKEAMVKFTTAITAKKHRPVVITDESRDPKTLILMGRKKAEVTDVTSLVETISNPKFLQGIVFDSLNHSDEKSGQGYLQIPLVFVAHGPFQKVASFVEKIENLTALITTDSITLSTNPKKPSDVSLQLTATLYQVGGTPGS